MSGKRLPPSPSLLYLPWSVFARTVSVFALRVFAWKKCLKAEIVRLSRPTWERLPAHPGPLQLVGFNRASEHTNSFPERNSVQIQSDSCFFY